MNAHKYFDELKEAAKEKQTQHEHARRTNDVIFQGWIISACDQLKVRVPADVELHDLHMILIDRKVECIGETTWEAGRMQVIDEIVRAILPPTALAAE